jgi:hypothetical protein
LRSCEYEIHYSITVHRWLVVDGTLAGGPGLKGGGLLAYSAIIFLAGMLVLFFIRRCRH